MGTEELEATDALQVTINSGTQTQLRLIAWFLPLALISAEETLGHDHTHTFIYFYWFLLTFFKNLLQKDILQPLIHFLKCLQQTRKAVPGGSQKLVILIRCTVRVAGTQLLELMLATFHGALYQEAGVWSLDANQDSLIGDAGVPSSNLNSCAKHLTSNVNTVYLWFSCTPIPSITKTDKDTQEKKLTINGLNNWNNQFQRPLAYQNSGTRNCAKFINRFKDLME